MDEYIEINNPVAYNIPTPIVYNGLPYFMPIYKIFEQTPNEDIIKLIREEITKEMGNKNIEINNTIENIKKDIVDNIGDNQKIKDLNDDLNKVKTDLEDLKNLLEDQSKEFKSDVGQLLENNNDKFNVIVNLIKLYKLLQDIIIAVNMDKSDELSINGQKLDILSMINDSILLIDEINKESKLNYGKLGEEINKIIDNINNSSSDYNIPKLSLNDDYLEIVGDDKNNKDYLEIGGDDKNNKDYLEIGGDDKNNKDYLEIGGTKYKKNKNDGCNIM